VCPEFAGEVGENGTLRAPYFDFGGPKAPLTNDRRTWRAGAPKSKSIQRSAANSLNRNPVAASSATSSRHRGGTAAIRARVSSSVSALTFGAASAGVGTCGTRTPAEGSVLITPSSVAVAKSSFVTRRYALRVAGEL
jgi:hypothetical protein